jgi:aminoglycoside phosphotransferase (APT) family kinase protein
MVLRVLPKISRHGLHEATIQQAVHAAGFPAPQMHVFGDDRCGLGFPFIVMARLQGAPLSPRAFVRLPALLAQTMVGLHALDENAVRSALAKAGVTPMELTTLLDDLAARAATLKQPGFAAGIGWLLERRPPASACVVCHGDFHPFNLVMEGRALRGLVDWSQALLAEPAFDVAYTAQVLSLWPIRLPGVPRPLGRVFGRFAAWRFLRAYQETRGELAHLAWYEALHSFRLLVRVARARAGITMPPMPPGHPWELVVPDVLAGFQRGTGIEIAMPPR